MGRGRKKKTGRLGGVTRDMTLTLLDTQRCFALLCFALLGAELSLRCARARVLALCLFASSQLASSRDANGETKGGEGFLRTCVATTKNQDLLFIQYECMQHDAFPRVPVSVTVAAIHAWRKSAL